MYNDLDSKIQAGQSRYGAVENVIVRYCPKCKDVLKTRDDEELHSKQCGARTDSYDLNYKAPPGKEYLRANATPSTRANTTRETGEEFGTKDYPCEDCGSPVGVAGWDLCKECNDDYEKRADEELAKKGKLANASPLTDIAAKIDEGQRRYGARENAEWAPMSGPHDFGERPYPTNAVCPKCNRDISKSRTPSGDYRCPDHGVFDPAKAIRGERNNDTLTERENATECFFADSGDPCEGRIVKITEPDGSVTKACEKHMRVGTGGSYSNATPSARENATLTNMACPVCQEDVKGITAMMDHLTSDHDMSEARAEEVLGGRANADYEACPGRDSIFGAPCVYDTNHKCQFCGKMDPEPNRRRKVDNAASDGARGNAGLHNGSGYCKTCKKALTYAEIKPHWDQYGESHVVVIKNANGDIPTTTLGTDQKVSTTTCTDCKHSISQHFYDMTAGISKCEVCGCKSLDQMKNDVWTTLLKPREKEANDCKACGHSYEAHNQSNYLSCMNCDCKRWVDPHPKYGMRKTNDADPMVPQVSI